MGKFKVGDWVRLKNSSGLKSLDGHPWLISEVDQYGQYSGYVYSKFGHPWYGMNGNDDNLVIAFAGDEERLAKLLYG